MENVYERLGVATLINANGPSTRLSGGLLHAEVVAAMAEASQACVDMTVLQARASELIVEATGAEAGIVTSGAAAGLLLATAACVTGLDPGRMNRLPDTRGMPNEVVMVRSQRNGYDHAIRTAGVTIVEVGLPDRFAGAGVRDAEAWELADAIGERTAALVWVAGALARPPLEAVVEVAQHAGVPLIIDAAAELPPASNLRRFVVTGADLVVFSGGKAIGGPQASGILCGRRDLITAAVLQSLDLDVRLDEWEPPRTLIDTARLKGLPQHGIGRACKVGKEEIIGLLVALRRFRAESEEARAARWQGRAESLRDAIGELFDASVRVVTGDPVPKVELAFTVDGPFRAVDLLRRLRTGRPSIHADGSASEAGRVAFNPVCLRDEDVATVAAAVQTAVGRNR
jgi:L-seryl-tRNA(Ser) seleniumtransferase